MKLNLILLPAAFSIVASFSSSAVTVPGDTNKKDAQGRKQGFWVESLPQTKWEGNYVNDKKEGIWMSHHFNGVLDELIEYKNDRKNGVDIRVDINGNYIGERKFKNDTLDGLAIEFLPGTGGKPGSELVYNMGIVSGIRKLYYPSGTIEEEGTYKNGKRDGETKWYYQSGKPATSYTYVMDNRSGPYQSFYENGNILSKGTFKNNKYEGEYVEFFVGGKPSVTGQYSNDVKTGEWKTYAEDGRLKSVGTYANDKKTGIWKEYSDDFTQLTTTKYANDKVVGKPDVKKVTPPPVPVDNTPKTEDKKGK